MKIGFDNGNVLCESDTEYLTHGDLSVARQIPGGFETVALAVQQYGAASNWIVSACGPRVQGYSWAWLGQESFFDATGFHQSRFALPRRFRNPEVFRSALMNSHVVFCERREHKTIIAQMLGLEAFVDDRLSVLLELPDCVRLRIAFRPRPDELAVMASRLDDRFVVVQSWAEVQPLLGLSA